MCRVVQEIVEGFSKGYQFRTVTAAEPACCGRGCFYCVSLWDGASVVRQPAASGGARSRGPRLLRHRRPAGASVER